MKFDRMIRWEADSGGNEGQQQEGEATDNKQEGGKKEAPKSFDAWLVSQDDTIKDLIDNHVDGLKSALDSERKERKSLAAKLAALGKAAEKGSELEKQLAELTGNLTQQERRAAFYETAHSNGVKNLKLAYLAAVDGDMFDRDGNVDFAQLRQSAPELFTTEEKKPAAKGNAGTGQGQQGTVQPSMNSFIRRAAGRR